MKIQRIRRLEGGWRVKSLILTNGRKQRPQNEPLPGVYNVMAMKARPKPKSSKARVA
jgi:hypothetical protein